MTSALLFEAEPILHPHVKDAFEQAAALLKRNSIPFRVTGGMALNFHLAGRPTKDVTLIVPRKYWHQARKLLQSLATDSIGVHFGLPGEPKNGLAVIGPHGVPI